ncbi:MAG: RNA polymerase factor sigma-54 [Burkholderiaceae bacterium]
MGSIVMHAEQRQQQKLSPRLQQAVRLLQLSSLDFAQELQASLVRNPFLELEDAQAGDESADASDEATNATASDEADMQPLSDERGDDVERDSWLNDGSSAARGERSGDFDLMNLIPLTATLAGHLHGQLALIRLDPRIALLTAALVDSLDDDGYLRLDLDELVALVPMAPPATQDELARAIDHVQSLEPAGVGARSLAECLSLQVATIEEPGLRAHARRIVSERLQMLAAKDSNGLARFLGVPRATAEAACREIRRFDPKPGLRFGAPQIPYITPDIVVKKIRGVWTASLNPAVVPRLRLNQSYADLFQRHRGRGNAELADHLRDARWAMRNVEQRFATILAVAQAILKRQSRYFEHGAMGMKPLGLREIAEEVGLHESTVSRVTNNKYMATPVGVLELKSFFSRAMTATSGAEFSGTAIRGLISEMVGRERPTAPLSDAEIARRLAQQGLVVARRTVTKYRHLMRLESVERRRHTPATNGASLAAAR